MVGDQYSKSEEYAKYQERVFEKRLIYWAMFILLAVSFLGVWLTWGYEAPVWTWGALGILCVATVWGGYVPYIKALNNE